MDGKSERGQLGTKSPTVAGAHREKTPTIAQCC